MHEPLYSADEMRAAEARYPGYPGTADELMERAAAAVAARGARASSPTPGASPSSAAKGANGGDGRIAARLLREAGRDAEETDDLSGADVVIDALFGTGFHGPPRAEAADADRADRRERGVPVLSVDLPSGVDASTGEIAGAAVDADLTVTFHGAKVGLAVGPGRFHAGRVVVADIGLEPATTVDRPRDAGRPRRSCRAAASGTRSSPPARSSSWAARRARPAPRCSRRPPRFAPTPAT